MAKKIRSPIKKKALIIRLAIVLVFVGLAAFGAIYFVKYGQVNSKYKDAILTQDEKNQRTIAKVAKLMDLPKDEKPTIFVVKDKEKLGSATVTKQFFDKTQNDDVILAYEKANISIIYRPKDNKIIKTDNYNNFLAAANPIKMAILAPEDKQKEIEKLITDKVINADIVSMQLPKANPIQSYVADATGQNASAAKELASKLGLSVGVLQEGELKPEGASLIIVIAKAVNSTTTTP